MTFQGQNFHANSGTKVAVLPKGRSSTANSGTKAAVLQGLNRCGSFPLLSAPRFLFSMWKDLQGSEKIPGAPMGRRREWIWLIWPFGLHRNPPQALNISLIRFFTRSKILKTQWAFAPTSLEREVIRDTKFKILNVSISRLINFVEVGYNNVSVQLSSFVTYSKFPGSTIISKTFNKFTQFFFL